MQVIPCSAVAAGWTTIGPNVREAQVTAAHEANLNPNEHEAMCWSRQHTPATAKRYYNKPTAKRCTRACAACTSRPYTDCLLFRVHRLAALSEQGLEKLRKKRKLAITADGEQYGEQSQEEPDSDEE